MIGELTYNEVLYSPDLVGAVKGLTDADLCALLEHLQAGREKGWPAERVQGLCILEGCRRFEEMKRTTDAHGCTRMGEMTLRVDVDSDHGSEVAQ